MEKDYYQLDCFFDDGVTRNKDFPGMELIINADLIFGVDTVSGREMLVFGRDASEAMATTAATKPPCVLRIGIDRQTDDLEKLIAMVSVVRARHDYEADG